MAVPIKLGNQLHAPSGSTFGNDGTVTHPLIKSGVIPARGSTVFKSGIGTTFAHAFSLLSKGADEKASSGTPR
jgi:hypothetical protein